jgi:hypothetical protein
MEKKLTTSVEEQLLNARRSALEASENGSLRPLGKLWGMDVFAWVNPNPGMIANTIHSFPFEVIWMGNESDMYATLGQDNTLCENLNSVIVYDNSGFSFPAEWTAKIANYMCAQDLSDAMELLKVVKASKKVLLFTVSGPEQVENRTQFEEYVKLVQVK